MDEFEIELQKDFLNEALDLLQDAEKYFLELEKRPDDKDLIDAIFRFAHNLKGTSRAVGLGDIAEITHKAENLLLAIKEGKIPATPRVVSILLAFKDQVSLMVEGLSQNLGMKFDNSFLGKAIEETSMMVEESEAIHDDVVSPAVSEEVENVEIEDVHQEIEPAKVAEIHNITVKKESRKDDETIRVSLNRLEKLNDLVGELVILRSVVESTLVKHGESKAARSLDKLCKEIQEMAMSLRMVSVGPTFQKLNRIVRDTSKALDKKVELRLLGEETEIDKTVVESLSDPLVHIIRNSIDHGIESAEERLKSGKSEVGIVEVMAFHEGNSLVIQITDDGKGINPDILIQKAIAKGIISPNAQLTHQQGIELIFHPGFSTKDVVSEISGRGVGMDVVKTNIENLGGEVKVRSKVGAGSCFRLVLPLTLAIIEGMQVQASDHCFIVPKSQVQEVIRIEAKNITELTGQTPFLSLREEVVPLYTLARDLGMKAGSASIALIIRNGETVFAVAISDVIKLQQVVVKPVSKELSHFVGVMGATILGSGKPSLILDLASFYMSKVKKDISQQKDKKTRIAA